MSAGAGSHKVIPAKRIKAAWRAASTHLSLRAWVRRQNGQIGEWAHQWAVNKRR